jgi:hypothetical protein
MIFRNVFDYINNRFFTKTHALNSKNLKKGKWHDYDTRLLYCAFDGLVDFCENEYSYSIGNLIANVKQSTLDKMTGEERFIFAVQHHLAHLTFKDEQQQCDDSEYEEFVKEHSKFEIDYVIELKDLYTWWNDYLKQTETFQELENEKLKQLIDFRFKMWT